MSNGDVWEEIRVTGEGVIPQGCGEGILLPALLPLMGRGDRSLTWDAQAASTGDIFS